MVQSTLDIYNFVKPPKKPIEHQASSKPQEEPKEKKVISQVVKVLPIPDEISQLPSKSKTTTSATPAMKVPEIQSKQQPLSKNLQQKPLANPKTMKMNKTSQAKSKMSSPPRKETQIAPSPRGKPVSASNLPPGSATFSRNSAVQTNTQTASVPSPQNNVRQQITKYKEGGANSKTSSQQQSKIQLPDMDIEGSGTDVLNSDEDHIDNDLESFNFEKKINDSKQKHQYMIADDIEDYGETSKLQKNNIKNISNNLFSTKDNKSFISNQIKEKYSIQSQEASNPRRQSQQEKFVISEQEIRNKNFQNNNMKLKPQLSTLSHSLKEPVRNENKRLFQKAQITGWKDEDQKGKLQNQQQKDKIQEIICLDGSFEEIVEPKQCKRPTTSYNETSYRNSSLLQVASYPLKLNPNKNSLSPKSKSSHHSLSINQPQSSSVINNHPKLPNMKNPQLPAGTTQTLNSSIPSTSVKVASGDLLNGFTIVLSGEFDKVSKETIIEIIIKNGGKCPNSISGKTSLLVHGHILQNELGPETSRKYKEASQRKIRILNQSEFSDFLVERLEVSLEVLGNRIQGDKYNKFSAPSYPQCKQPTSSQPPQPKRGLQPINLPKSFTLSSSNNGYISASNHSKVNKHELVNLWTTKHSPLSVNDCVGNNSQFLKIMEWLKDWTDVVIRGNKKQVKQRFYNAQAGSAGDGFSNVNARACLISGPPGVGKTTSVRLIAEYMGYEIREWNASDERSKKSVNNILGELKNNSIINLIKGKEQNLLKNSNKFIILMDEVDGMSSGDRGGNQALIDAIKSTNVPILCICNDRMHPKVRSLANYCYDVKFVKPPKQDVAKHLLKIVTSEGYKDVDLKVLEQITERFNCDIRQMLSFLEMHFKNNKQLKESDFNRVSEKGKKDMTVMMNAFEASLLLMQSSKLQKISLREQSNLFFIDYDLIPLIVQQNYLDSIKSVDNFQLYDLVNIVKATSAIAESDIVSAKIRGNGSWSLLGNFGFLSSIYPCDKACGEKPVYPRFPDWLGKNSTQKKTQRELREFRVAIAKSTSGSRFAVKFDYVPALLTSIIKLLKQQSDDSINKVLDLMEAYGIKPEHLKEHMNDLMYPKLDYYSEVPTAVKTKLTKEYNLRFLDDSRKVKGITETKGKDDAEINQPRYDKYIDDLVYSDEEKQEVDEAEQEEEEDKDKVKKLDEMKGKSLLLMSKGEKKTKTKGKTKAATTSAAATKKKPTKNNHSNDSSFD